MGALANQPFVKMNGVGNEIVVVDLRGRAAKIEAEEARVRRRRGGVGRGRHCFAALRCAR